MLMEPTEERKHLTEVILGLHSCSKQYFACQVLHLADLRQQRSQSLIPILRFGYLILRGYLSEKEAVAFLTPLYREARLVGKADARCPILEILAGSKDPKCLKEELRKAAANHFGEDIERPVEEEVRDEPSDDPSDDSDGAPGTVPVSASAGVSSQSAARG
jgi:hypothetical protein